MALETLLNEGKASPITDDDRIAHTSKVFARTFGVEASEVGAVELRDGRGVVVVELNGESHILRWRRSPRAHIQWFADGQEEPLALSAGASPIAALAAELGR
jgi:hypothetical protein